jgi:thiol-disulfide isomerase/thioredoxin
LNKKHWLIDLSLIVIIIAMGVFVYIELSRTFDFMRQRSSSSARETVENQQDANLSMVLPTIQVDELVREEPVELRLSNLAGESVALSDFHGTPLLINFWATWCPPCLQEMPLLQAYAERYTGELTILAINAGEDEDVVRAFVTEQDLELSFLLDPTNSAARYFRVYGFPTSLFFDKDAELQATFIGELDEELLDMYLLKIGINE